MFRSHKLIKMVLPLSLSILFLSIAGCNQADVSGLEKRIAELESKIKVQEEKQKVVEVLAAQLGGSPFASLWQQFLLTSDQQFMAEQVDVGRCWNACIGSPVNCDNSTNKTQCEEDKIERNDQILACTNKCPPLVPQW